MERGHYVAFINVGPNLKVRKSFPIVGVFWCFGTLKFQEGDINVECWSWSSFKKLELFCTSGCFVWFWALIFLCPLENLIEFFGRMGVKWRDLSKFTLPLEKGSYFPLLLIQWFFDAFLCQAVSEADRWHVLDIPIGLNRGLPEDSLEAVPIHWPFWSWPGKKKLKLWDPLFFFCDSTFWHVFKFDQQISSLIRSLFWVKWSHVESPLKNDLKWVEKTAEGTKMMQISWIFALKSVNVPLFSEAYRRSPGSCWTMHGCYPCDGKMLCVSKPISPFTVALRVRRTVTMTGRRAVDEKEGNTVKWHDHHINFDSLSERGCK